MENEMEKDLEDAIRQLAVAAGAAVPDDALKWSQAALNLAKARTDYFWPTG